MISSAQIDELRSILKPDQVLTDPSDLEVFGKDWSGVLAPDPMAVVFPKTTEEVSQVLKWAHEREMPVVPSGGRTGLSGGAMAARKELVLSLTKMNQMGEVDLRGQTIWVQAGVITEEVHKKTQASGLTWPVDFASKGSSQVGGNISTNAGGVHVIRYGLTRNWVLGLKVVTMDGRIWDFLSPLEKNNTGLDFKHLFIGTEGVLGVITEAMLKLSPLAPTTQTAFLALEKFEDLFRVFEMARAVSLPLRAFECLDLGCYRESCRYLSQSPPVPLASEVFVLVEFEASSENPVFQSWLERVLEIAVDGVVAQTPREARDIWRIRESIAESLMNQTRVHQQDISVPVGKLEMFITQVRSQYAQAFGQLEFFLFGHIGDGNLHVLVRKPGSMAENEFVASCSAADRRLFEFVQSFHGSVSAEHGIGLLKKKALGYSRSQQERDLLLQIKKVLDPKGLLNPGKIVGPESRLGE